MIDEPRKRPSATCTRVEGQFALSDDLKCLIADFELAALGTVVPTRAETEVSTAALDELFDAAVAGASEDAAVA